LLFRFYLETQKEKANPPRPLRGRSPPFPKGAKAEANWANESEA
jgi:hypothetical protein